MLPNLESCSISRAITTRTVNKSAASMANASNLPLLLMNIRILLSITPQPFSSNHHTLPDAGLAHASDGDHTEATRWGRGGSGSYYTRNRAIVSRQNPAAVQFIADATLAASNPKHIAAKM
jgi:hypothetical protein